MSNSIIPHLLSDSPPPIAGNIDEDYDDEFGDFTGPGDLSFDNDNTSTPSTPKNSKHFYSDYPTLDLDREDHSYEINKQLEKDSPINDFTKELPNRTYINILDHLENNIPNLEIDEVSNELNPKSDSKESSKVSLVSDETLQHINENSTVNIKCDENNSLTFNDSRTLNQNAHDLVDSEKLANNLVICEESLNNDSIKTIAKDVEIIEQNSKVTKNQIGDITPLAPKEITNWKQNELTSQSQYICDDPNFESIPNSVEIDSIEQNDIILSNSSELDDLPTSKCSTEINDSTEKQFWDFEVCNNPKEELGDFGKSKINEYTPENFGVSERDPENIEKLCMQKTSEVFPQTEELNSEDNALELDNVQVSGYDSSDDFGDFSHCQSEDHMSDMKGSVSDPKTFNKTEFGNLHVCEVEKAENVLGQSDDEFDDFADYSAFNQGKVMPDSTDEFSEYSTFTKHSFSQDEVGQPEKDSIHICQGPEEALKQAQLVLKTIFGSKESNVGDYINFDLTMDNPVFNSLKEITETNALRYQWGSSTAQKNILKTLNIDKRNIDSLKTFDSTF